MLAQQCLGMRFHGPAADVCACIAGADGVLSAEPLLADPALFSPEQPAQVCAQVPCVL